MTRPTPGIDWDRPDWGGHITISDDGSFVNQDNGEDC